MTFIDFHSVEVKEATAHLTRLRPVVGSEFAAPLDPPPSPTQTASEEEETATGNLLLLVRLH